MKTKLIEGEEARVTLQEQAKEVAAETEEQKAKYEKDIAELNDKLKEAESYFS
jgi:hypothetical protein